MNRVELEQRYSGLACAGCGLFQKAEAQGGFAGVPIVAMTCVEGRIKHYPHILIMSKAPGGGYVADIKPDTCLLQLHPGLQQSQTG